MRAWRIPTWPGAVLLLALVLAAGAVALQRMHAVSLSVESVYRDRVLPLNQLRLIQQAYQVQVPAALAHAVDGSLARDAAIAELDRLQALRQRQWADYLGTYLVDEEKRLIAAAEPVLRDADAAIAGARQLLLQGDSGGLARFAAQGPAAMAPAIAALQPLIELQVAVAEAEAERSQALYRQAVWLLAGVAGLAAACGGLLAWAVTTRHAREQALADQRSLRQARHFEALSRTNHAMVRIADPQRLFDEICQICADTGLGRLACILVLDGSRLRRVAAAGPALPFLGQATEWDLASPQARDSTAGQALAAGARVVRQDYARDTHPSEWRRAAALHGIRGIAALPFRRGGQVAGLLNLYAGETDLFTPELLALLDEMVEDLSFALDHSDNEAAMAVSLERFRRLFHSTPLGTVIVGRGDRRIVDVNDAMCRRYDTTREAMIGRTMQALGYGVVEEDRARLYEIVVRDGSAHNVECQVRMPNGDRHYSLVTAEPITYLGQDCIIFMGLDITERHQAEEARRETLAAELANRAKTEFLSRMSHELRTPLHAVLGFTQLLQADARAQMTELQRGQLGQVLNAGWHLLDLINDILDVSRIEAGRLQVAEEAVDAAELVQDVLRMSEPLAHRHGVTLAAAVPGSGLGGVLADRLRLRQVLLNLVSNGIKYNRAGGSVRVTLAHDGGRVQIEVIDSGLGMTANQLEHLYEPFNRLGRERGGTDGTGIGLTITRQLVQMMGGELVARSEAGVGTTMRVSLRHAELPAAAAPVPSLPTFDAAPAGTVLYIEDNPVNALLVEQLLLRWPAVRLVNAVDGASGIAAAGSERPDLVLLDMQLPDMSGVEILQALRSDAATRALTVVALSASAMPEEVTAARDAGASDYWTKPLDFSRFLRDVSALLHAAH